MTKFLGNLGEAGSRKWGWAILQMWKTPDGRDYEIVRLGGRSYCSLFSKSACKTRTRRTETVQDWFEVYLLYKFLNIILLLYLTSNWLSFLLFNDKHLIFIFHNIVSVVRNLFLRNIHLSIKCQKPRVRGFVHFSFFSLVIIRTVTSNCGQIGRFFRPTTRQIENNIFPGIYQKNKLRTFLAVNRKFNFPTNASK